MSKEKISPKEEYSSSDEDSDNKDGNNAIKDMIKTYAADMYPYEGSLYSKIFNNITNFSYDKIPDPKTKTMFYCNIAYSIKSYNFKYQIRRKGDTSNIRFAKFSVQHNGETRTLLETKNCDIELTEVEIDSDAEGSKKKYDCADIDGHYKIKAKNPPNVYGKVSVQSMLFPLLKLAKELEIMNDETLDEDKDIENFSCVLRSFMMIHCFILGHSVGYIMLRDGKMIVVKRHLHHYSEPFEMPRWDVY